MKQRNKIIVGNIYTNSRGLKFIVEEYLGKSTYRVKFIESGYITETTSSNINRGNIRDYITHPKLIDVGYKFTNNQGLEFEILEYIGNDFFNIQFTESGYKRKAQGSTILKGEVRDMIGTPLTLQVGYKFTNTSGYEYEVIERTGPSTHKIRFLESGYEINADNRNIVHGSIKDRLQPSVYGVGCLGYINNINDYIIEYKMWAHILERCYNKKCNRYKMYGGSGVIICERWKRFDLFLQDLPFIPGYNIILIKQGLLQLDKDFKQFGIEKEYKVYSPETCVFLPENINSCISNYVYGRVYDNSFYVNDELIYTLPLSIPALIVPAIIK